MPESPRAFREKNPYTPPPPEYKPPSLLAEHWRLASLFALVCIAFAVYCFKAPRAPLAPPAAPAPSASAPPQPFGSSPQPRQAQRPESAEPIYIEPIPQKDIPKDNP